MNNEDDFLKFVADKLKAIRKEKRLTLVQVEELGYRSWRHLQKIEAGKDFKVSTLYRICVVYQINPSALFAEWNIKKGLR